ncbi:hypothetical protein HDU91_003508, partial [Kappamyces sp. JEL0680]
MKTGGVLSANLAKLADLNYLNVTNSRLSGPIDGAFGKISWFVFSVRSNNLTGPLPAAMHMLGNGNSSVYMDVRFNDYLNGTIPAALATNPYLRAGVRDYTTSSYCPFPANFCIPSNMTSLSTKLCDSIIFTCAANNLQSNTNALRDPTLTNTPATTVSAAAEPTRSSDSSSDTSFTSTLLSLPVMLCLSAVLLLLVVGVAIYFTQRRIAAARRLPPPIVTSRGEFFPNASPNSA